MVWFLRLFLVPFAQISIRFFRFFVAFGYCCNFRKSLTKHSFMIFKHWHYLSFGYSHMQLNLWLMQFFVDLIFACSSSSCFFSITLLSMLKHRAYKFPFAIYSSVEFYIEFSRMTEIVFSTITLYSYTMERVLFTLKIQFECSFCAM